MGSIIWNKMKHDVKVKLLNEQHKRLFDTLKELYCAMEDKSDKAALLRIINNLSMYIKEHLGTEEALLENGRGRPPMGRKKKPRLEDYEPGSMEYLKLKVELLERENLLLKKALPLVQEKIRNRSRAKSGTSSSEN